MTRIADIGGAAVVAATAVDQCGHPALVGWVETE